PSIVSPGPGQSSPGFSAWRMTSRVSAGIGASLERPHHKSTETDTPAECLVAHRHVLARQIVAGAVAEIEQAAHRVFDRREVAARNLAHLVEARGTDLDLHVGVDGAGREAEEANARSLQHQRAGQHGEAGLAGAVAAPALERPV